MRGVLFDLDGTLLHMDLDAFLRRYLVALSDAMSPAMPGIDVPKVVMGATEAMHACKPHARFFEEVAASIGCAPAECMMVGDDATADMAASAVGMRTCYVGSRTGVRADHHGDMTVVASLLERSRR